MNHKQNKISLQNAFTLLEVMIAMVIFAVGMLGLAGIQGLSLENSHTSYSRSQAILLAYDMVDRMKANPTGGSAYVVATGTSPTTPSKLCNTEACSNTEMAAFDLWQWKSTLPNLLISGNGQVVNTGGTYTITVHWDEDRTGATGTTCPPAAVTDLRCFTLITRL